MVAWAICTTLTGIVHNYGGLMVIRSALGLAEGGLFPGVTFYITMWYRRHECGLRIVRVSILAATLSHRLRLSFFLLRPLQGRLAVSLLAES
jgi:MFS family permease